MNRAINSALGTTRTRQKIEAKLTRGNESNANFALCILSWNTNFQDYLIRVSIAVIKDVILKVLRGEIQEDMNLDLALQILKHAELPPCRVIHSAEPSYPRTISTPERTGAPRKIPILRAYILIICILIGVCYKNDFYFFTCHEHHSEFEKTIVIDNNSEFKRMKEACILFFLST